MHQTRTPRASPWSRWIRPSPSWEILGDELAGGCKRSCGNWNIQKLDLENCHRQPFLGVGQNPFMGHVLLQKMMAWAPSETWESFAFPIPIHMGMSQNRHTRIQWLWFRTNPSNHPHYLDGHAIEISSMFRHNTYIFIIFPDHETTHLEPGAQQIFGPVKPPRACPSCW